MIKSCEKCSRCHEGTYGSGRFCSQKCAKARSGEDNPNYGKECKPETRKKISEKAKGRVMSKETRKKISDSISGENHPQYGKRGSESPSYGRTVSDEVKIRISEKLLGREFSEGTRKAMSIAKEGGKLSKKHKENISKGLLESDNHPIRGKFGKENPNYGKECKPETRKKISDSNKGKKFTKEHKRRLSEVNSCSEGRTENRGSKAGWIGGLWFHSSWEVGFYLHYLEKLKLPVVRNCRANGLKGFPYLFEGSLRTYYPDFYLPDSDEWVEVKGCFFDDRDKAKTEAKIRQFPHKLTLIQGDEMKPYLTYAEETYGKDFSSVLYDCQPEPNQELYETLNQ